MTPEDQALINRVKERIRIRREIRSADDRIANDLEALVKIVEDLNYEQEMVGNNIHDT